jgi:hypothetical protein
MAVVIQKADGQHYVLVRLLSNLLSGGLDNAHCLSKDLLLDVLQVRIGQVLEVLSFDEDWWIVRPSKDPLNIGGKLTLLGLDLSPLMSHPVAFSGNLRPHWPHPDPSRTSLATAIFSCEISFHFVLAVALTPHVRF